MDLRPYIQQDKHLKEGIKLIEDGMLCYQPFILADDIEVGEGRNFVDQYSNVDGVFDLNVSAPSHVRTKGKRHEDIMYFRKCNGEYRSIYEYYADVICKQFNNDISNISFAEIGCNTGLNLFNLATRGAKSCIGYDWNEMTPVFNWLNGVLNTNVQFKCGVYDNLYHRFSAEVPEVDVMVNTVFTNHQCDLMQFLCYIADRARKGMFLSCLTVKDDSCAMYYPETPPDGELLDTGNKFPLYFNNGVMISEKLLLLALRKLGFADVQIVEKFVPSDKWALFQKGFSVYYAKRTSDVRSAYMGQHPGQVRLENRYVRTVKNAIRKYL